MAIYFHGLQNSTIQEQYTACLNLLFCGDFILQISLFRKNRESKLLAKINWFTVHDFFSGYPLLNITHFLKKKHYNTIKFAKILLIFIP